MSADEFHKRQPRPQSEREAAGLTWLAQADAVAVVPVVEVTDQGLTLVRVTTGSPTIEDARVFGRDLARLHAAGAESWGSPPPGCTGDGWIGAARLRTPQSASGGWAEFYAADRLLPHLAAAGLSAADEDAVLRVVDALGKGRLDHSQPGLVGDGVARLHGDLWSGNVLWSPAGAVLIDPAAHGGHAESDLAFLDLFGLAHLRTVLAGYQAVSPLAPGWQRRIALHQLHPLLVHAELFGGGYRSQVGAAARSVLGPLG